jgi:hypothetical protein
MIAEAAGVDKFSSRAERAAFAAVEMSKRPRRLRTGEAFEPLSGHRESKHPGASRYGFGVAGVAGFGVAGFGVVADPAFTG